MARKIIYSARRLNPYGLISDEEVDSRGVASEKYRNDVLVGKLPTGLHYSIFGLNSEDFISLENEEIKGMSLIESARYCDEINRNNPYIDLIYVVEEEGGKK